MPEIRKSLNDAWNSDDTVITAIRTSYYVIPYLSSGVSVLNWAVIEIRYQAFKDNRILGDTLKSSSSQDQLNKARNDAAWAGGSLGLEYFSNSNELVGAITTTSDLYSITNKGKNVFQEAYKYRKDIIKSISSEINKIFNKRGGSKESKSK